MSTPLRFGRLACSAWPLLAMGSMLVGAAEPPAESFHDNVVIVLDASGSMGGRMPGGGPTKMAAAKSALKTVLQRLPPNIQVGFLVFGGSNIQNDWVYPLGPRDDARLMTAIDLPLPGRGTPLGAYIKKGADRLLQERERQFGYGTFRLLIVTDGEAQDQALVERYTPEVIARGITVDVIGVAMNQRHTLATRVHSYRAANDPQALQSAIAEVFAEVGGTGRDTTGAEAFAELATLPNELALAAIQALATSGNEPIGERPSAAQPSGSARPSRAGQAGSPAPSAPVPPPQGSSSGPAKILVVLGSLGCCGGMVLILLVLIVKVSKRSRRR